ncbi:asparaginase [Marinomonas mediterranea]|uniref:asparaginase n=1 Tax=Marinomonas mediterranea TaxID=119864 RepID=UPI00234BC149|nr:asparaginase [Marinomonas mediterranea]WCN08847.1 asparaginase [Marinomonas mediterranea]WCN12892.1 asparaginase [Marinomonas mediterranea]
MMNKILIVYTGGTIGMMETDSGLAPSSGLRTRIHHAVGDNLAELPLFDVIELTPLIDSANIAPDHWARIYDTLQDKWNEYDGFVVLHGTDTLSYSASMLSYMFGACNKNIVITGSQIPLGMKRSDGLANLEAAMSVAETPSLGRVTVLFHHHLMEGTRTTKFSSHKFDAFKSFNTTPLAELSITQALPKRALSALVPPKIRDIEFKTEAVGILTLHPGLPSYSYQGFLDDQCKGLILQTYGAGNIADHNEGLLTFLKQMKEQRKTVVNVTQCHHGGTSIGSYAAGSALTELDVLDGKDLTLEAAFTKLHWLLSNNLSYDDIKKDWNKNISYEASF